MALGDSDIILDDFSKRNLGTSGLASRRIQQNNIESLQSLRANLSQSEKTLQNTNNVQKQKLSADYFKNVLSQRTGGVLHQGTRSAPVLDPNRPTVTVGNSSGGGRTSLSVGVSGDNIIKNFNNVEDIISYLRDRKLTPDKFNFVSTGAALFDEIQRRRLEGAGVQFVSNDALKNLTGYTTKTGFGGSDRTPKAEIPEAPLLAPAQTERFNTPAGKTRSMGSLNDIITSLGKGYRK